MQEVPHHLVDTYLPSETVSTGEYCKKAADIIKDILSREKVKDYH
jgi:tRNA A37 N6-isopentenylltransferase MiaA